jgi:hypothetical protein
MGGNGMFDTIRLKLYSDELKENILIDQTGFCPEDVARYHNTVFRTMHNSIYSVDSDGRISGRPSIEGARIELIGGIDPAIFELLYHEMGWCCRPGIMSRGELDTLIREFGQKVEEGLRLAITIVREDPETGKFYSRIGMTTSPIERMVAIPPDDEVRKEYVH